MLKVIRIFNISTKQIDFDGRCAKLFTNGDDSIQYAEFDLSTCFEGIQYNPNTFFFVTVTDKYGNYAVTRGYFIKDLIEEKYSDSFNKKGEISNMERFHLFLLFIV